VIVAISNTLPWFKSKQSENAQIILNTEKVSWCLLVIGRGLCVLVGIHRADTRKELEFIVRKVLNLRLFEDPTGDGKRWNKSAKELDLEVLCISQFTLYHTIKGNKPDFHLVSVK
jgi:D-tyrosyl-tRNA(Tyr) deacylase